jgi:hypothetical protein
MCPFFQQQVVGGISHENGIAYRELRGQLCDEPERMRIATAGKLDISTMNPHCHQPTCISTGSEKGG